MNRIKLSNNLFIQKACLIVVFVAYFIGLICTPFNPYSLVLILVFCLAGYPLFFGSDHLEFNDQFMFIIRSDSENQIPLKDIFYISPKPNFSNTTFGEIKYHTAEGDCYVNFLPRFFSKSFSQFKKEVLLNNPNVDIRGYNYTLRDIFSN